MNLFRFLGDMSHILSFVILLHKIVKGKSAAGISLRTQEMYLGEHRYTTCCLLPVFARSGRACALASERAA